MVLLQGDPGRCRRKGKASYDAIPRSLFLHRRDTSASFFSCLLPARLQHQPWPRSCRALRPAPFAPVPTPACGLRRVLCPGVSAWQPLPPCVGGLPRPLSSLASGWARRLRTSKPRRRMATLTFTTSSTAAGPFCSRTRPTSRPCARRSWARSRSSRMSLTGAASR